MISSGTPKDRLIRYLIGAGLLAFLAYIGAQARHPSAPIVIQEQSDHRARNIEPSKPAPAPKDAPGSVTVHVVGAVKKPGVYTLTSDKRWNDAVLEAGGFTKDADQQAPNLAAHLVDGIQVVIPTKGGPRNRVVKVNSQPPPMPLSGVVESPSPTARVGRRGAKAPTEPVSLSSATAEQLETVPGIGPATAQRILTYRSEHGAFGSLDELTSVGGIGLKKLEKMRPYLTP